MKLPPIVTAALVIGWLTSILSAQDETTLHRTQYADFVAELKKNKVATHTVDGVFIGVEQGDYTHWQIKTKDGTERSFFVLKADAALEKVLENPKPYHGKSCRITWKKSVEDIPEAGGKMEIEQVLAVEWLK